MASGNEPRTDADPGVTRERALLFVLALLTILAFYGCVLLARPFLPALAWALALAIVARPIHDWISARVGNAAVAAGLAVVIVAAILVLPALFVARELSQEATRSMERARNGDLRDWRETVDNVPWLADVMAWADENINVRGELAKAVPQVTSNVTAIVQGSIYSIVQLLVMLFALYFFFHDRHAFLRHVRKLVPLSERETDEVFTRVADTMHATINGTIVVAMVQGTLGGLMFWWLGLPAPVTWGLIMALLAIVPYLGAPVIWAPTAAFLALQGDYTKALILTVWGVLAVGLIDNLLYPLLVGKQLRLHTLVAFIAMLGGLAVFGAAGIVLGPMLVAVTIALVDIWRRRTAHGAAAEEGIHDGATASAK